MKNFYKNIILKDQRINTLDRIDDLELLEPVTRQKIISVINDARSNGVELLVFETFRSKARQQFLFEQGVTKLREVGVHHFGLACDLVLNINGAPSWEGDFSILGRLSRKYGLIWGGDWGKPYEKNNFVDAAHLQRCSIIKQSSLFSFKWYPKADYNPFEEVF